MIDVALLPPLIFVVAVVGFVALSALVIVPPSITLVGLILARTLSDLGASSGGSLLPSSIISGAISVALISLACIICAQRLGAPSPHVLLFVVVSVFALSFWTLIGIGHFGVSSALILDTVRFASYVAAAVAAYSVSSRENDVLPNSMLVLTMVPASLLIISFLANWGPAVNGAGRAVGTFSHANSAAAYLAIAGIASFGLFFHRRRKLLLISAGLAVLALGLTQSLGGLLGFGLGALVVIVTESSLTRARRIAIVLLASVVAVVAFVVSPASARLSELDGIDPGRALASGVSANSLEWRFINWQALLDVWWSEAPWTGFGIGATGSYVMPLGAPPHSVFVEVVVETGILGAGLSIFALVYVMRKMRRISSEPHRAIAMGILTFILVNGAESNLLGYTAAALLGLTVIGVILGLDRSTLKEYPRLIREYPHVRREERYGRS
jgi:O-antigen ligase